MGLERELIDLKATNVQMHDSLIAAKAQEAEAKVREA